MLSADTIEERSRQFYDSIADDYERLVDSPQVRAVRECFWHRAEAMLPEAARVLDFGAGSGLDARHFAALGHSVTAFDVSEGMLRVLKQKSAEQVAAGAIVPILGPGAEARRELVARAPFDAVLCNFAVFSTLPRLDETFRLFGELVRPGGAALICIQNPWYIEEVLQPRSFLPAVLKMPFAGVLRYPSAQSVYNFRHTPGQVRRAARPEFIPDTTPPPPCCGRSFPPWGFMRLVALRRT